MWRYHYRYSSVVENARKFYSQERTLLGVSFRDFVQLLLQDQESILWKISITDNMRNLANTDLLQEKKACLISFSFSTIKNTPPFLEDELLFLMHNGNSLCQASHMKMHDETMISAIIINNAIPALT